MFLSHGNTIIAFNICLTDRIGFYCYSITYHTQNSDQYIYVLLLYYYVVAVDVVQMEDFLPRYYIIIITIYERV